MNKFDPFEQPLDSPYWAKRDSVWATYRLKATSLSDYGRTLQLEPQQIKRTPMEPKYRYFASTSKFCDGTAFVKVAEDSSKRVCVDPDGTEDVFTHSRPNALVNALDLVIRGVWKEITKEQAEALVKPKVTLKVGQHWKNEHGTYVLARIFGAYYLVGLHSGCPWSSQTFNIDEVFGTIYPRGFTLVKDV